MLFINASNILIVVPHQDITAARHPGGPIVLALAAFVMYQPFQMKRAPPSKGPRLKKELNNPPTFKINLFHLMCIVMDTGSHP